MQKSQQQGKAADRIPFLFAHACGYNVNTFQTASSQAGEIMNKYMSCPQFPNQYIQCSSLNYKAKGQRRQTQRSNNRSTQMTLDKLTLTIS